MGRSASEASQSTRGGPPWICTVLSFPPAKKPSERLSADQNREFTPSVPGIESAVRQAMGRTQILLVPFVSAPPKASCCPSGDIAGKPRSDRTIFSGGDTKKRANPWAGTDLSIWRKYNRANVTAKRTAREATSHGNTCRDRAFREDFRSEGAVVAIGGELPFAGSLSRRMVAIAATNRLVEGHRKHEDEKETASHWCLHEYVIPAFTSPVRKGTVGSGFVASRT